MAEGVRQGLLSARRLWRRGFGQELESFDYPGPEIFEERVDNESTIGDVLIPNPKTLAAADPDYWCILNDVARAGLENDVARAGLETVAFNYVITGQDPALDRVPVGQFRNLKTVDRSEIESNRSIQNLIREYLSASRASRPLSIAVFGAPGSGKSFGVTEVAESVAPGEMEKLEFNLSQFTSTDDLIAAFHKVRDVALSGKIPIVSFDEFDSDFNGQLGWLKYFLEPMQDGKFRDGEALHPIGRAILVFAGGTCCTFAEFSREDCDPEKEQAFKNAKGPDFVSRLRGYVNIKGPNPVSEDDRPVMIRRALFLRFLLEQKAQHLFDSKKRLAIDPGVLRALIKVPEYKHGVRSMSAIIEMSMLAGRKSFEQAALPSPEQLELHVDAEMFSRLVVRDVMLGGNREDLAKAIHEKYRQDQKNKKPEDDPAMAPWEELMEDFKDIESPAGRHIPVKLKAIGCDFRPVGDRKPDLVEFTREEIEEMAEMEHARWTSERFLNGWSLGPRDPEKKTSPYLVEWDKLPVEVKQYDRDAVRAMPEVLAMAGFEIYRLVCV